MTVNEKKAALAALHRSLAEAYMKFSVQHQIHSLRVLIAPDAEVEKLYDLEMEAKAHKDAVEILRMAGAAADKAR